MLCGNCRKPIVSNASACPHCGKMLDGTYRGVNRRFNQEYIGSIVDASPKPPKKEEPPRKANFEDHVFTQSRKKGSCDVLRGNVGITFVFVNDSQKTWTEQRREIYKSHLRREIRQILEDARKWNIPLNMQLKFLECTIEGKVTSSTASSYVEKILEKLRIDTVKTNRCLEKKMGVDKAPLAFVFDSTGRDFAVSGGECEYCVLFDRPGSFRHELYHLFGAKDFYYPEVVADHARAFLPGSVMLDSESINAVTDPLTAYLIGWTDTPNVLAEGFLTATAWIPEKMLSDLRKKQNFTGYGTKEKENYTYTGYLSRGIEHGYGTMRWKIGDLYQGMFENGQRTGWGIYYWPDGNIYEGEFLNSQKHGKGKLKYVNGDVYEGDFVRDERTGKGIFRWADGESYEGDFIKGEKQAGVSTAGTMEMSIKGIFLRTP